MYCPTVYLIFIEWSKGIDSSIKKIEILDTNMHKNIYRKLYKVFDGKIIDYKLHCNRYIFIKLQISLHINVSSNWITISPIIPYHIEKNYETFHLKGQRELLHKSESLWYLYITNHR